MCSCAGFTLHVTLCFALFCFSRVTCYHCALFCPIIRHIWRILPFMFHFSSTDFFTSYRVTFAQTNMLLSRRKFVCSSLSHSTEVMLIVEILIVATAQVYNPSFHYGEMVALFNFFEELFEWAFLSKRNFRDTVPLLQTK